MTSLIPENYNGAHVNFILTRRDNLHLQAFTEICSLQNSF